MNRKLTARERWFVTALPAIIVLAVYGYGVYSPQQKNLAGTRQELIAAQRERVTQAQVNARRLAARSLQDRLAAAKRELSVNPSGPQMAKGLIVSDEVKALAKITDAFKRWSILVVASTRVSDSDARDLMPTSFGETIKSIPGSAKGVSHGGVWRMEMIGNFGDLRASLAAVDAVDVLIVPLCISMEPSPDSGALHHWSLWVWM